MLEDLVPDEITLPGFKQLPSHCVLTRQRGREREQEWEHALPLVSLLTRALTSSWWPHPHDLISPPRYLPKAPYPKTIILWGRAST